MMTLNNIAWSFSDKLYADQEQFNQEVIEYQKYIFDTDEGWKTGEIVFDVPELQIQYMAWIKKPSVLLKNETLIEEDKDVFDKYPEEEEHQVEILAKLKADNGKNFTALEFLLKVHNQQANKYLGDHIFFEGISEGGDNTDGLPIYYVSCGS